MVQKEKARKGLFGREEKAVKPQGDHEQIFTDTTPEVLARAILENLYHVQVRVPQVATLNDWYMALAYTIRDRIMEGWFKAIELLRDRSTKMVAYLSAEFLEGPHLGNNLINLGIWEQARKAVAELGLNLETLLRQEPEPGLGNGGLGRLAACYMDSLATLQVPAIGYGIRYEFGIFNRKSGTAGRWKKRTIGCAWATRGRFPGLRSPIMWVGEDIPSSTAMSKDASGFGGYRTASSKE